MASSYVEDRDETGSPLLSESARQSREYGDGGRRSREIWDDAEALARQASSEQESKSSWYLFLLTLSIGG